MSDLPEDRAPPAGRSLRLELVVVALPDGGGAVLVELVEVGADAVALWPSVTVLRAAQLRA